MPRLFWLTEDGKAEAAAECEKAVASIQRKRDSRKKQAIELHDSGLTVNEIKTEMGLSRRTVKRYLKKD